MNLRTSILKVFSTNILQLVSNIIIGFIVPAMLSLGAYSNLKTYTLYLSYIGLLHFGFVDGLFIKYGGKSKDEICLEEFKGEHTFLLVLESLVSILFLCFGFLRKDMVLILFGLTILPYMIQAFHRYIYQATAEFGKYTSIMNIYSVSYALINIFLVFVVRSTNYIPYCAVTILANILSLLIFEYSFIKTMRHIKPKLSNKIFKTMKVGLFIMIGNLAVMGLFGIDKWFIKLFFDKTCFAYYSFAVSMLNIVNILVNAISITFYSFLFKNNSKEKLNMIKESLIILGSFASVSYFPIALIINYFLPKYIPSLGIISITFSIFSYMITLNALYVNLYKVNKNEKLYLKVVLVMLLISIFYNTVAVAFRNMYGVSFATLITLITWYVYSSYNLKDIKIDKKMFVYPILTTIIFLLVTHFMSIWSGFFVYFVTTFILSLLFYKKLCVSLLNSVVKK